MLELRIESITIAGSETRYEENKALFFELFSQIQRESAVLDVFRGRCVCLSPLGGDVLDNIRGADITNKPIRLSPRFQGCNKLPIIFASICRSSENLHLLLNDLFNKTLLIEWFI